MSLKRKSLRYETRNYLADSLYETGNYWVRSVGAKGFDVYEKSWGHSTRVTRIGWQGARGLTRAQAEADSLQSKLDTAGDL